MIKAITGLVYRPSSERVLKHVSIMLVVMILFALSGCDASNMGIFAPKGQVATEELKLTVFAVKLMLVVVIPTIFLALFFGWYYNAKRGKKHTPEWKHSYLLEAIWWGIPCIIILVLGTVTWKTTHSLDPFRPLDSNKKPVVIEVVSLDWKWLFIYPDYKIATINYLRIPTDTPINFKLTAAAPMNSFVIPQLGGQIYAMTGMTTQLHLMADTAGSYRGFAANYTGKGFAGMNFIAEATSPEDFTSWVKTTQAAPDRLTADVFWNRLVPPSTDNPVGYFGSVDAGLFDSIVMHYMMPEHSMGQGQQASSEQSKH